MYVHESTDKIDVSAAIAKLSNYFKVKEVPDPDGPPSKLVRLRVT